MRRLIMLFVILSMTLLSIPTSAEIPHYIQFQGKATDAQDNPLNGSYKLTFRIYDAEAGGNLVWSETHNSVEVENGVFSVLLGGVDPANPLDISFDRPYWISIEINEAGEMPRQMITSVGYAYRAGEADYALVAETINNYKLKETTAVNFSSSMSAAEIQALVDAQPRYLPYGTSLIFQFADGTYVLEHPLTFDGFYGGGHFYIQGNTSEEAALHTNQTVHLNFSAQDCHGILIKSCSTPCTIWYLKITVRTNSSWVNPIYATDSGTVIIYYNYCLGTSTNAGHGIRVSGAFGDIRCNYVSNMYCGITASTSVVFSRGNDDIGTPPKYGLYSVCAGIIGKDSTQPAGSVINDAQGAGSVIR